jgi:hypothetical protein
MKDTDGDYKICDQRGVPRILPGGMHILADLPPPPPDLDPDPHQDFELDPDPAYFTRTVLLSSCSILEIKRLIFIYNVTRQKISSRR